MNTGHTLHREEIALAMELRSEGVYMHHIADGLGVTQRGLEKAIRSAEKHGRKSGYAYHGPWLGRTDLAAQTEPAGAGEAAGGDAGQPAPDHVDPAADTAGAEWLDDHCRAVDREVYPCQN